jgi:ubiquinone biosynthesis protein UbiJ
MIGPAVTNINNSIARGGGVMEQLWDDRRIRHAVAQYVPVYVVIQMRDEYEAALAQLRAEIVSLRGQAEATQYSLDIAVSLIPDSEEWLASYEGDAK